MAGGVPDRRELALEEADDPLESDFLRRPVETVSTAGATHRAHDPGVTKDRHHLRQHGLGGVRHPDNLFEPERPPVGDG